MKHYEASSTIRATPEVIWGILTDGPSGVRDLGPSSAKFAEGLKRHAEQRQGATQ